MKSPEMQELLNKAVKGTLNAAEQVRWQQLLGSDAELRAAFEEEMALEQLLGQLPDVPISSNFTALVVQAAVQDEQRERGPQKRRRWGLPAFLFQPLIARATVAAVLILGLGLSLGQYRRMKRAEMALNVRSFSEVASVISSPRTPAAELFQNFEAIQRLSLPAEGEVDMELLIALQK